MREYEREKRREKRKFEVSEARGLKRKRTDYRGKMKRPYFIEAASLGTLTGTGPLSAIR